MKRSLLFILLLVCGLYLVKSFDVGGNTYEIYNHDFEEYENQDI